MAKSIVQVDDDKFDQVQDETRKSESASNGKAERLATSKAESKSDTSSEGKSQRTSISERNLSGQSTTSRESIDRCNIGFQISFRVKITTKIPTEPGTSC